MALSASEKEIENSILDFLNMHPHIFAWKNHTTGIFDPKKAKFRKLGGHSLTGVSDILGIIAPNGIFLALEVKTPKTLETWLKYNMPGFNPTSSQSKDWMRAKNQKSFIDQVVAHGGIAGCVASVEEAMAIIQDGLGN